MKKTDLSKKNIINDPINLYDQDFFKWTQSQSKLLRNINIENLDIVNFAESMIGISNFPEKCPWKIEEILPFLCKKKK